MSEAFAPDPDIALLDRVAALDMAAAEHVHAKLLAADDVREISELGRTYQRTTRSLRQTLALKAKLKRDAAQAAAGRPYQPQPPPRDPVFTAKISRIGQLQNALARVAGATGVDEAKDFDILFDRLDVELDDWMEQPDFLTDDLDAQVLRACRLLDLPEALADGWRDLPHPDDDPAETPSGDDAAEREAAARDAPEPPADRWAGTWPDPPRERSG